MRCDFAGAEDGEEVKNGNQNKMWQQDFELLKAQFCNNMAVCYQKMGDLQNADIYNNWALKECPDYAKALHRKCCILEAQGEYTQAVKVSQWCAQRFAHEDEPEENQQTVPHFKEVAERCKPRIPIEKKQKNENLKAEADAEFDAVFEEDDEMRRMNDLFEEAFAGFNFNKDDDEDGQQENNKENQNDDNEQKIEELGPDADEY